MKTYSLPEDLRTALLEYLSQRPWREVADAMPRILQLKEVAAEESERPLTIAKAD